MKKTWRKLVKTFFSFQRSDRNAILILALLIVVVYIAKILLGYFQFNEREDFSEIKAYVQTMETMKEEESRKTILFDFDPNTISPEEMDTLAIPQNVKQNLLRYRKAGGTFKTVDDVQKIYGMNDSVFCNVENSGIFYYSKKFIRQQN